MKFPYPDSIQTPRIELNITELCNLRCSFCPRAHGYPNQNIHMSMETLDLILESRLNFYKKYDIILQIFIIGRGEPTLHNDFDNFITRMFEHNLNHYGQEKAADLIVTNGYKYSDWIPKHFDKFQLVDFNCYSDRSYVEYLKIKDDLKKYKTVRVQDRGTTGKNEVGVEIRTNDVGHQSIVKYVNRSGAIPDNIIPMKSVSDAHGKTCRKPWTDVYIDVDGEYRLCCNDWTDLISFKNIREVSIEEHLLTEPKFKEYRFALGRGDRSLTPCNKCNAFIDDDRHEEIWRKAFATMME